MPWRLGKRVHPITPHIHALLYVCRMMTDGMRPGQDTGDSNGKETSQFSRPKSSRSGYGERMSLFPGSRRSEHSQASDAIFFFFLKSTFSPPHGYNLTWNWVSGQGDQTPPPALPNLTLLQGAAWTGRGGAHCPQLPLCWSHHLSLVQ